ncbi:MAG: pre-peptidase C-terminal domain-containing protein [Pirellulaceae bacterium]
MIRQNESRNSHNGGVFGLAALTFSVLLAASTASAQLPAARLGSLYPAGAKAGETIEVTIAGDNLDGEGLTGAETLTFSHAGITARQKTAEPGPFDDGPQPVIDQFVVTVAANVPVGLYEARVSGKYGMSNPRAFSVGDLPEVVEVEPNNDREAAVEVTHPVVVNGKSQSNGDVDFYKFTASAGQRIIAMAYARRIDSPLDCVLTVYDAQGRQIAGSRDTLEQDSLVDFRAASTGDYFLKVHDSAFLGSGEHVYRIHLGVLPVVDFVFPPAAVSGNQAFTVYGRNLPGGKNSGLAVEGAALEQIAARIPIPGGAGAQSLSFNSLLEPASAAIDATEYRVKGAAGVSNPVLVGIAAAPTVNEIDANDSPQQAQPLTAPCEVMGKFYPARDRDWFRFEAKQGEAFTIELISQRMNVHANPSLLVQRVLPVETDSAAADSKAAEAQTAPPEQTQQLAYVFESPSQEGGPEFDIRSEDPVHHFIAPAEGTYRIMVRDAFGDVAADPRRVYRLTLNNGQPDFRLAASPEGSHAAVLLRKGGQRGVRVVAFRRDGFDGEIEVSATNLPPGVTCTTGVIGPAQQHTMLLLSAAANARPAAGLIQVVGKAKIGNATVTRQARFGTALAFAQRTNVNATTLANGVDARLARDLAVSVSAGETSPISNFQAGGGKVWETSRGGRLKIPVARAGAFKGKINFVPRGLPPNVNAPAGAVNANQTSAEFQIDLRSNTPTGTYTFYLDAIAEQVDYTHNPEAAAAAAERKKEVDQIKVKADADAKAAATAKASADKLAADAATALQQATTAKTAADQALTADMTAAKAAADQAAKAKAAAAAKTDDAALQAAAAASQKASVEANAKLKTAMAAVVDAQKKLDEAAAKAEATAKAKLDADEQAAKTAELAQLAAQLKTTTDKLATDTANAAKPKKVNVPVVSSPVTLKIAPAPITMTEPKAAVVKQGEKVETPITIARLFDFKDPVNLQVVLPSGVGGLSIPNATIAANQTQGKLAVTAAAGATPGQHQLTVRGTLNINGQGLTVEQPLTLTVQEVKAP